MSCGCRFRICGRCSSMMELLAFLLFLVLIFAIYHFYRKQEEEIAVLKEKVNDISQKIPAIVESVNSVNMKIPTIVEGAVAKTFQSSASMLESLFSSTLAKNSEIIKGAFATSLKELGIQEDLGKLSEASADLKAITSDLKSMFQIKQTRARFGEMLLENLLKDIFPLSRIMFRRDIGIGTPDACILVEDGKYLCIDSKFPLENFRKYSEAESDAEKKQHWNSFIGDLKKHVEDIRSKYVGRENTLDFALMFVPSDAIYYQIISEEPDLAIEASKAGVILASPSVLPAYLNLISARIQAQEISRRTEEIQRKLGEMGRHIENLGNDLETLLRHIRNASNKASDVGASFNNLKNFYSSVCRFEEVKE